MKFQRLRMLVRLLTCLLILMAVAVQRNGSIFGHAIEADGDEVENPVNYEGNTVVVNTSTIANDIKGYGGPVPLEITITDGVITNIEALRNSESEQFFCRVREELLPRWVGISIYDLAAHDVDGISGATLSSNAVNATIRAAAAYVAANKEADAEKDNGFELSLQYVITILIVIAAAVIPLFVSNKIYRSVQLVLNIAVLGFWSGTFLSYEVFVNYIANGANFWSSLAVLLMLVVAFVYPYFGRKNHYCAWVCPLGSLQEIAGKCVKYKFKISPRTVEALSVFQECLWFALIFLMIAGIWFEWMNWELFTAFVFNTASVGVVIAAVVVVILSLVVQRPYCRFVCPTGYLFQITQNPKK